MALAITYAAQATPSTTSPITVTYTGVVGRLYALFLSRASAADPFTTVTDTAGNTWTRQTFAPTSGTTGRRIELWTLVPGTAFTSITIAFTGTALAQATLVEITGQDTTFINQVTSDFRASSTTPAQLTVTPSVANTLIVCAVQANANTNAQITSSGGWTRLTTHSNGPAVAYKLNATNGVADGTTWTFTSAAGSGHLVVAFAPASAPPGLTVSVWNGTTEDAATVEGVWNGTTVTAATLDAIST